MDDKKRRADETAAGSASTAEGESPKKKRADGTTEEEAGRFCEAIMADSKDDTEDTNGLIRFVMRDVPELNSNANVTRNIVIRQEDHTFWTAVLRELSEEGRLPKRRVAVVGSPGIGKSTTAAFAIRLLLKKNKTVVYKYRTPDNTGYYFQFKPAADAEQVQVELFPESTFIRNIFSLYDKETYYVIDPGKTKDNCSPGPFAICRVIIVASPDEGHWGGSGFEKEEGGVPGGIIRYFPAWSLPQLKAASTRLKDVQFINGEVAELYSIFGGIPRQVFAPQWREDNLFSLNRKIDAIKTKDVSEIVKGQTDVNTGFGSDQPSGGIVEFKPKDDFKDVELVISSPLILSLVRKRFMSSIWKDIATCPSAISWQLLENYVLLALQKPITYTVRACVGKSNDAYNHLQGLVLGGCTKESLVSDCTRAVMEGDDLVAFHSSDNQHALYDIIYKSGTVYHAFQVTKGAKHPAQPDLIKKVVSQLQIDPDSGKELKLYYAVHEGVFDSFRTEPVAPAANTKGVSVYRLKLVAPAEEN